MNEQVPLSSGPPTYVDVARRLVEWTGDASKSVTAVIETILKKQLERGTESTKDERDALDLLYGYVYARQELKRRQG